MYGLIGQMIAMPGKRDALIAVLVAGTKDMPGCLSYVISQDAENENALWITEVWDSKERHAASLALPSVQQAIVLGKPMISGFGQRFETTPVGGLGLGD
jgi:quinol monooxygenase YgiN